jgi:hypothetical protein
MVLPALPAGKQLVIEGAIEKDFLAKHRPCFNSGK